MCVWVCVCGYVCVGRAWVCRLVCVDACIGMLGCSPTLGSQPLCRPRNAVGRACRGRGRVMAYTVMAHVVVAYILHSSYGLWPTPWAERAEGAVELL